MNNIPIKTPSEIGIMRENGRIAATILHELFKSVQPGVQTIDLEHESEKLIRKNGVKSAFKGFEGYKHNLVTCVNEEMVHGIPSHRKLKENDVLTIDFGIYANGFYSDLATTRLVGQENKPKLVNFLDTGQRALSLAIDQAKPANHIGDISHTIQSTIEKAGYNVIRMFVGHGVGRNLHEEPQIPCFGKAGTGPLIKPGMVLAIEIMYSMGGYNLEILDDGWTAVTRDLSLTAMFEHSVAITENGPEILTQLREETTI